MARERRAVRFFMDLQNGYDPEAVSFMNGKNATSPPIQAMRRVWIEVELPSDSDLFPEVHSGVELGRLRFGERSIQVDRVMGGDQSPTVPAPAEPRRWIESAEAVEARPDPRAER